MITFNHTINDSVGLHMRPAKRIAEYQKSISSKITIEYNGSAVAADKLLRLVTLGAVNGSEIKITVDGADEQKDAKDFKDFLIRIL